MPDKLRLSYAPRPGKSDPTFPRAVLLLAYAISIPADVSGWPPGLLTAWNEAVDAGAFNDPEILTAGDHARAFLRHRLLAVEDIGTMTRHRGPALRAGR